MYVCSIVNAFTGNIVVYSTHAMKENLLPTCDRIQRFDLEWLFNLNAKQCQSKQNNSWNHDRFQWSIERVSNGPS